MLCVVDRTRKRRKVNTCNYGNSLKESKRSRNMGKDLEGKGVKDLFLKMGELAL